MVILLARLYQVVGKLYERQIITLILKITAYYSLCSSILAIIYVIANGYTRIHNLFQGEFIEIVCSLGCSRIYTV